MKQIILGIATDDGDVIITEDALASITEDELKFLRISRDDLIRCFAEGEVLMRGVDPKAVLPIAYETIDGRWLISLARSKRTRHRAAPSQSLH